MHSRTRRNHPATARTQSARRLRAASSTCWALPGPGAAIDPAASSLGPTRGAIKQEAPRGRPRTRRDSSPPDDQYDSRPFSKFQRYNTNRLGGHVPPSSWEACLINCSRKIVTSGVRVRCGGFEVLTHEGIFPPPVPALSKTLKMRFARPRVQPSTLPSKQSRKTSRDLGQDELDTRPKPPTRAHAGGARRFLAFCRSDADSRHERRVDVLAGLGPERYGELIDHACVETSRLLRTP